MKYILFLLAAGVIYVCCRFGAMAGWWASLSRRVRSYSASSFQSGARATGGRGMAVRPVVNSSRVAMLGSIFFGIGVVDGYLTAEWLGDRDFEEGDV